MGEMKFGKNKYDNLRDTQKDWADWENARIKRQAENAKTSFKDAPISHVWNSLLNAANSIPNSLDEASLMQAEDGLFGPAQAKLNREKRDVVRDQALDAYKQGDQPTESWRKMLDGNWSPR